MATKTKKQSIIHKVTVHGLYSASGAENGKLFQRPYELTFLVRDEQHKKDGALSLFKHCIAEKALKRTDPHYVGLLTHDIKETQSGDHELPTDISLMNRAHLLSYIEQEELEVHAELYDDTADLQQAVMDCENDPASFAKAQAHIQKSKARKPGGTFRDDLDELNAHLFGGEPLADDEDSEDDEEDELEAITKTPIKLPTKPAAKPPTKPVTVAKGKPGRKVDKDDSPV